MLSEAMRFPFHHRAFYCYMGMTLWIFFLIAVMYKYMSVGEETVTMRKVVHYEYISKSDAKYKKLYVSACNPPESIARGTEGVVDNDTWLIQGVLVVTRHGDRGPLTHLRGGDKLPCDTSPASPLLKSYVRWVGNASAGGRAWWVAGAGPFHNFPALPARAAATRCALGQLTPRGLLQMLTVGSILREAYADKLGLDTLEPQGKKDTGWFVSYSTRYRRTFQSLAGALWALAPGAGAARAAAAREAHSVAYCFRDCACAAHHALDRKINSQGKKRLNSHPAVKELVVKLSRVLFESQEHTDAEVARDALLAYMCHDIPLPCAGGARGAGGRGPAVDNRRERKHARNVRGILEAKGSAVDNRLERKHGRNVRGILEAKGPAVDNRLERKHGRNVRGILEAKGPAVDNTRERKHGGNVRGILEAKGPAVDNRLERKHARNVRGILEADGDALNAEMDYLNQMEFNNDVGRRARDTVEKTNDYREKQKAPLDFDAQMEREKLAYYQQRYMDNAEAYGDVVIVKKNLDADFNFPNDARMDTDFDEDYREPTPDDSDDFCIRKEHVVSLFSYLEWGYRQEMRNIHNRRRGLLVAYGLIHHIVRNMIRMISENKPKFVFYSGHDKTLRALILALGLNDHQHYNVRYASRMAFEVYRRRDLRDEFKFTKRRAVAQDFYFRIVYNGDDVTSLLSFCRARTNVAMRAPDPLDDARVRVTHLCPIENIVRFIHDDYFAAFNVTNFKDACATYGGGKRIG